MSWNANPQNDDELIARPWTKGIDQNGQPYYINTETGQIRRQPPITAGFNTFQKANAFIDPEQWRTQNNPQNHADTWVVDAPLNKVGIDEAYGLSPRVSSDNRAEAECDALNPSQCCNKRNSKSPDLCLAETNRIKEPACGCSVDECGTDTVCAAYYDECMTKEAGCCERVSYDNVCLAEKLDVDEAESNCLAGRYKEQTCLCTTVYDMISLICCDKSYFGNEYLSKDECLFRLEYDPHCCEYDYVNVCEARCDGIKNPLSYSPSRGSCDKQDTECICTQENNPYCYLYTKKPVSIQLQRDDRPSDSCNAICSLPDNLLKDAHDNDTIAMHNPSYSATNDFILRATKLSVINKYKFNKDQMISHFGKRLEALKWIILCAFACIIINPLTFVSFPSKRIQRKLFLISFMCLNLTICSAQNATMALGFYHTCARWKAVQCWGRNDYGELGYGDTDSRGDNPSEMGANLPPVDLGSEFVSVQVVAGWQHTCALSASNVIKCFGDNYAGQLGSGDKDARGDSADEMGENLAAVDLGPGFIPMQIAAGDSHTCALSASNSVKCWGYNDLGQLGYGDTASRGVSANEMGANLTTIALGTDFIPVQIVTCGYHTCALSATNKIKCWGYNLYGQLGIGDALDRGDNSDEMGDNLPEVGLGTDFVAVQIAAGGYHTCALSNSSAVKCWGSNYLGQLGYGNTEHRGDDADEMDANLAAVDLGAEFIPMQIVAGWYHTCALSELSDVKCWGYNVYGEIGSGDIYNIGDTGNKMGDNLTSIALGTSFHPVLIAAGGYHTCALSNLSTMKCWGRNTYGQLGSGDTVDRGRSTSDMGENLLEIDIILYPTANPTANPTIITISPTANPSISPTDNATKPPTEIITESPTKTPNGVPTSSLFVTQTTISTTDEDTTIAPTNVLIATETASITSSLTAAPSASPTALYFDLQFICKYNDESATYYSLYISLSKYAQIMLDAILTSIQSITYHSIHYEDGDIWQYAAWTQAGINEFKICSIFNDVQLETDCVVYDAYDSSEDGVSYEYIATATFGVVADQSLNRYKQYLAHQLTSEPFRNLFELNMNQGIYDAINVNSARRRSLLEQNAADTYFEVVSVQIVDPLNINITTTENEDSQAVKDNVGTVIIICVVVVVSVLIVIGLLVYVKLKRRKKEEQKEGEINDKIIELNRNNVEGNRNDEDIVDLVNKTNNEQVNDDDVVAVINKTDKGKMVDGNRDELSENDGIIAMINNTKDYCEDEGE